MVSEPSSSITPAMRLASFLPSAPRQLCTLYDAIRSTSSPSCASSARQLARLLAGLAMLLESAAHAGKPALDRPGADGQHGERAADQPPVHRPGAAHRRFDRVAEARGGEPARQ